jgi:aminopeptidase S
VDVAEPLRLRAAVVATAVFLAACSVAQPAATSRGSSPIASPGTAAPSPTESALPDVLTAERVSEAITPAALSEHLAALQAIADAHGGSRATGMPGFEASAAYVETALGGAGYVVERHSFDAAGTPSASLVVERPGAGGEVVMLGAHLDSVAAGPGINDNGSGVAALLVIAERLAELPAPRRTVRFAFWGAEEGGPFGSTAYVAALEPAERRDIVAYLNFDMIGSPNAIRLVYDEAGAAPGSAALTHLFATALASAGLAWEPIDLEGDSDHGPFTGAGIPTGGLFSGGIEPVTDAQAAASFGAIAGEPADACSHRACDTIDNVDLATLDEMADAIAAVLVMLAVQAS